MSRKGLMEQDLSKLDVTKLHPLSPEVISRQATINIGTIGHVAHGKSTIVKAISGVQTVCFKNELERNITIKLGYANAKIYKCEDERCPRPMSYKAYGRGYFNSLFHKCTTTPSAHICNLALNNRRFNFSIASFSIALLSGPQQFVHQPLIPALRV
ncbi:hypothetical protein RYX36_001581 [Vicia faba]